LERGLKKRYSNNTTIMRKRNREQEKKKKKRTKHGRRTRISERFGVSVGRHLQRNEKKREESPAM